MESPQTQNIDTLKLTPEQVAIYELRQRAQRACLLLIACLGKAFTDTNYDVMELYSTQFEEIFDHGNFEHLFKKSSITRTQGVLSSFYTFQWAFYNLAEREIVNYLTATKRIKNTGEFYGKGYAQALMIFICGTTEDLRAKIEATAADTVAMETFNAERRVLQ